MKKNTSRFIAFGVVFTMLLTVMVLFVGCGDPKTLEEYVANDEEATKTIESYNTSDASGGMTMDVKDNSLICTYKFAATYEGASLDAMKPAIESSMDNMKTTFTNARDSLSEESGIEDITVKVIFQNGDGSEIYSKEY